PRAARDWPAATAVPLNDSGWSQPDGDSLKLPSTTSQRLRGPIGASRSRDNPPPHPLAIELDPPPCCEISLTSKHHINQPTNQPTNQSINQSINQSTNQPTRSITFVARQILLRID